MAESRNARALRPLAWPVATGTAYALAFVVVYVVAVGTERGRLVSDASLRGAVARSPAVRNAVDVVLNVVSVASLLGAVAVVAVIALVRLDRVRGLAAIGALCSANLATYVLKEHLLSRPDLELDEIGPATLNSQGVRDQADRRQADGDCDAEVSAPTDPATHQRRLPVAGTRGERRSRKINPPAAVTVQIPTTRNAATASAARCHPAKMVASAVAVAKPPPR